jgi:hypothetical protein
LQTDNLKCIFYFPRGRRDVNDSFCGRAKPHRKRLRPLRPVWQKARPLGAPDMFPRTWTRGHEVGAVRIDALGHLRKCLVDVHIEIVRLRVDKTHRFVVLISVGAIGADIMTRRTRA